MKFRTEHDALGPVKVPQDAYFGSFVVRAKENFQLSGQTTQPEIIVALGIVKLCAAQANMKLGQLDKRRGGAIARAAKEVIGGKWDYQFVLDPFQAGAGTPNNMNANEIIANRAIEILGGKKGDYSILTPNNHVNMAQSSNDVMPTVTRIACYMITEKLIAELELLEKSFLKKSRQSKGIIKAGRTHLQDAVPIMVSQELDGHAETIRRHKNRIKNASKALLELGLGGTAIGSGITAHQNFHKEAVKNIAKYTKRKFYPTKSRIHMTQSMDSFSEVSSSIRNLSHDLIKICNDLMILNSGPKTGIGEITLPEVEPGSSIMPGKVNPSVAEAMKFCCMQTIGCEGVIAMSAQEGHMQLNTMAPLIGFNFIFMTKLLTNGCDMFRRLCIDGMKINKSRIKDLFDNSLVTATSLSPYIGYHASAIVVNIALEEKKTIRQVIEEHDIVPVKYLNNILDPVKMTKPRETDMKMVKSIKSHPGYKKFMGEIN